MTKNFSIFPTSRFTHFVAEMQNLDQYSRCFEIGFPQPPWGEVKTNWLGIKGEGDVK